MYRSFKTPTRHFERKPMPFNRRFDDAQSEERGNSSASAGPSSSTTRNNGNFSKLSNRMLHREEQWSLRNQSNEFADEMTSEYDKEEYGYDDGLKLDEEVDAFAGSSLPETPTQVLKKRQFSSEQNSWNPSALIQNCCYNAVTGRLLSKEICKKQLDDALKSKKSIDFYDILKFGDSPEIQTMSFALYMLDKVYKRTPKPVENEYQNSQLFNLERASEVDTETFLPGRQRLTISMLIDPASCSNWIGRNAITNAIISIAKKIEQKDEFFLVYASPDSERTTHYPRIPAQFFEAFSVMLEAGFSIKRDATSTATLVSNVRRVFRNYIDKQRRSSRPESIEELLNRFLERFEIADDFRSNDQPLQEARRNDSKEAWKRRKASKPVSLKRPLPTSEAVIAKVAREGVRDTEEVPTPKVIRQSVRQRKPKMY